MMDTPPTGGSTGCDHQDNPAIDEAAGWLAATPWTSRPHPVVPDLQRRFGLTVSEACQALRLSRLILARAL